MFLAEFRMWDRFSGPELEFNCSEDEEMAENWRRRRSETKSNRDDAVSAEMNAISGEIVDAAIKVHSHLGPGLLENSYEVCLKHELVSRGRNVESQVGVPIVYDGIKLEAGYRIDLLVDRLVLVELKATESIEQIHIAQVMTYLRHSNIRLGLLLNFNVKRLTDGGLRRIVL